MKARPTKASSLNEPGVSDVITPYRKGAELIDNFVYIAGPAEILMSFVPCYSKGGEQSDFTDIHTWDGKTDDTTPWEHALQGCGEFQITSISQSDETKKIIVPLNLESQIEQCEGKTDEELEAERSQELEQKKELCTDGTNTVTIDRYLWHVTLVFESQAKMILFTKSSWSTKPFIAGHPSLKVLSEGLVICRTSGAVLPASSLDSYISSEMFLSSVVNTGKKTVRTLTQVLQTALNILQRNNFEKEVLPHISSNHNIEIVNDSNNVPRFVKIAEGRSPTPGNIGLKLILWGADTLYSQTDLFGDTRTRLQIEIKQELERRIRDVFQLTEEDASITVIHAKRSEPVVKLHRSDIELSQCSGDQPYSVIFIDAKPIAGNKLLKQRGVHIPFLSKGQFAISRNSLWFDMATHATLDHVDDKSDLLYHASHPPTTPIACVLQRLVKYGLNTLDGSLYESKISLDEEFSRSTEESITTIDESIKAQFIDKATRGAIIPSGRPNYNHYVETQDKLHSEHASEEVMADLKKRFDDMADRHQKQVEKDRQSRLSDRGALTAVLMRQHKTDSETLKITQRVEGEGTRAATTVEVTVNGKVLSEASGFKKNRIEVCKKALIDAVKASPYSEATDADFEQGKAMLNTWWKQVCLNILYTTSY